MMANKNYYLIRVWDAEGNMVFDDLMRSNSSNNAITNVLMNGYVKRDISIGKIECKRKMI